MKFSKLGLTSFAIALTSFSINLPVQAYPSASKSTSVQASAKQTNTIVDIAASNPNFSTLVAAVKAAGLVETLSGQTQLTVFAPTNEAFAALPKGTLKQLLKPENREALRKVLTYHVVAGALESTALRSGQVKSVEGSPVNVRVMNNQVRVNDANVISADVKASNGVIHVIDRVILPPNL
ncbi:fasciclin domain-containing protein [Phormidium sp. CLA17]|uniref:fasciclin domain-containing protein n=1 Tax=Leptolyngbya sp. Cla-17 TaxID=2803751 RepID=UPI001490ACDF|nr:fasciclin domain-containing protein [Leptolyngbya sp. Cla-17]MBM0744469.1 fasciclin domain-containing protein [Leptolyngbya sp. Cla-17]